jgi:hypothetical protein
VCYKLIATLFFPLVLILPGLWILQITKIRVENIIERLSLSYILSLAIMFVTLYIGGIFKVFSVAAFIYFAITLVSLIHLFTLFIRRYWRKRSLFSLSSFSVSTEKLVIIISIIALLSFYAIFLNASAILDSDVVQYYLPIARELVNANEFVYGYDFNILLKPIGDSVLYGWTYVISGSTQAETFRLMPLAPILLLILLNYAITTFATKSKTIGIISTAIFLALPFHDRFLLYTAFYPDMFYYPIIFAGLYFLIRYSYSKHNSLLVWTGVGLGVGSLFKAQTIFVLITFIVLLLVIEFRTHKKISIALCCLAPFYMLTSNLLANSFQEGAFLLYLPVFSGTQLILFAFLFASSGLCCYIILRKKYSKTELNFSMIKSLVKKISFLLIPVVVLSSLWYLNNLLRFNSIIWTSSINLPNFDWALGVLQSLETVQQTVNVGYYLSNFIFMFLDPAVMGYVMFVPFLIGLFIVLRKRIERIGELLLFSVVLASIILSNIVISLHSTSGYNPRDIFVLTPLLTTISAIGVVSVVSSLNKIGDNVKRILISILLVAYFGLVSYVHSVLLWFTSAFSRTITGNFAASFGSIVGLTLAQTSFQLSYTDRALFVGDNILRIISLSLIAGIPVLIIIICRYNKLVRKHISKVFVHFRSSRLWFITRVFVFLLFVSILIFPRFEVLSSQGGAYGIKEFQLRNTYGDFYEPIIEGELELNGSILTFRSPSGLQYYLPESKIIDLRYPANLAFLKDTLLLDLPSETVSKLKQKGINYLLVNPSSIKELDNSLNSVFSNIISNPENAILSQRFDDWKLYTLGPYTINRTLIPLSGWSVDPRNTNASYTLYSTESEISLHLDATDISSRLSARVTIYQQEAPKLALSEFNYVTIDLKGSDNARVLIRFFLDDGTSFDVSYWKEPYIIVNEPFDLSSYVGRKLRGDVYVSLRSSDGTPSSLQIVQVSLVNIK